MPFQSNILHLTPETASERRTGALETSAEVIQFPAPPKGPRPLPKLELLTALFAAVGLVGGPAHADTLAAIVHSALMDRTEASVREEIEALLDFYAGGAEGAPEALRIFERLSDGRYALSEDVRGFLS